MPKKLKLDLNGLKVNSFVTSLENNDSKKIKGGVTWTEYVSCSCAGDCPTVYAYTCDTCLTNCEGCNTDTCGYSETNCDLCDKTAPAVVCNPD